MPRPSRPTLHHKPLLEVARSYIRGAKAPRMRTMREFAEQDVVLPDGPYEGRRFKVERQPYTGLWFDGVDSGAWNRCVATGPTQSGKTLCAFVIPILYHLFEVKESVICGIPDLNMATDKWRIDLLPVLRRSRFADLLPAAGSGSRGGKVVTIDFKHGPVLRFMSGGGGDKQRAGFTSRVVVITEADGMDVSGGSSREADKITQLEARTRAYGPLARVYMECTASVEEGRIWRELQAGTNSRPALPCPKCHAFVSPDRGDLMGFQDAETIIDARQAAAFICPACKAAWTDLDRILANRQAILLHGGQAAARDKRFRSGLRIEGPAPRTDTFSFRWSAVNNLFNGADDVSADEWRAARAVDEDNAERELTQFVWALPYKPPQLDTTPLDANALAKRVSKYPRGLVPSEADVLTMHVDLGKWLAHYMVTAWKMDGTGWVIDYDVVEIHTDRLGVEKATYAALQEVRDRCEAGWARSDDEPRKPDQVWIDSGWSESKDAVWSFCRQAGDRFRAVMGRGEGQQYPQTYRRPKRTGAIVVFVGEEFHVSRLRDARTYLVEVNADYWKSWSHERLQAPIDAPGSLLLFNAVANEHLKLSKHLTAERKVEEWIAGKGTVIRWERIRRANHWLDNLYNCCAAAYLCGVRLIEEGQAARPQPADADRVDPNSTGPITTPDGRPYLITER